MLEIIANGFRKAKKLLIGYRKLTETNISEALEQVRISLLEADVNYEIIKDFLTKVKNKSLGKEVKILSRFNNKKFRISASDYFIDICFQELKKLLGPVDTTINISKPVTTIMIVGLQGVGKTTTAAKLALFLKKKNYRTLLVACDNHRPAAIQQLKLLSEKIDLPIFYDLSLSSVELCKISYKKAKKYRCNIIIFDTAGRLSIDLILMKELTKIKNMINIDNIFLVLDSMMGQDSLKTAINFNKQLDLDGFILTKLDGDSRGGVAISVKQITNKPIKFLGLGEGLEKLEEFRPAGLASRILGMGDIVGLISDFNKHSNLIEDNNIKQVIDNDFTLDDFLSQLKIIKKMGSVKELIEKIPGANDNLSKQNIDEQEINIFESIVLSMTKQERNNPKIIMIENSRIKRISFGSGRSRNNVLNLLKRFNLMKKMIRVIKNKSNNFSSLHKFKSIFNMFKSYDSYRNNNMFKNIYSDLNIKNNVGNKNISKSIYRSIQENKASNLNIKLKKLKRKKAKKARKKTKRNNN